jgi:hypothetical protein
MIFPTTIFIPGFADDFSKRNLQAASMGHVNPVRAESYNPTMNTVVNQNIQLYARID